MWENLERVFHTSRQARGRIMNEPKHVVAIVDDDQMALASLQELLESAGYTVRSFSSAEQLVASTLSEVNVLITDIGLPGKNGFELRDIARAANPAMPVFLVTGRHEIANQSRAQGVSGFFRKPFEGKLLLAAIAEALRSQGNSGPVR